MPSITKLALMIACLSTMAAAIPAPRPPQVSHAGNTQQAIMASTADAEHDYMKSHDVVRLRDSNDKCPENLSRCGDICYHPTEAECDQEFMSITKFGPGISKLRKKALEAENAKLKKREMSSSVVMNGIQEDEM